MRIPIIAALALLLLLDSASAVRAQFSPYEQAKRAAAAGPLRAPAGPVPGGTEQRGRTTAVGPFGGVRTSGYRSGAFNQTDGSQVQYGTTYDTARGPFGGAAGRRTEDVMVTAPGGNGYVYSTTSQSAAVAPRIPPPVVVGPRIRPVVGASYRSTRSAAVVGPYGASYRRRTVIRP